MDGPGRCNCGYAGTATESGVCPRCGCAWRHSSLDTTRFHVASDAVGQDERPQWFDAPTLHYAAVRYTPPTGQPAIPVIPGYEILGELGRGGMGVVYKARQTTLNRVVALKMILAGGHAGPKDRERFCREAEAVAALQHPHIVQIFEIGEHNGQPYLALELVDGGTLADRLAGHPWPFSDAAALVERLARTVQYAHDQGIVHRDLKPGNILIADHGPRKGDGKSEFRNAHAAFKVTDFGLAKRLDADSEASAAGAGTGPVVGTPNYIAPEQAAGQGRVVGPAADIYSLGAILYELLTGRPPFQGDSPLETVLQVLKDEPVLPSRLRPAVPKDLETICLTCLHKNPARRYASAAALAEDLHRFLDGRPVQARPVSAAVRAVKWARRHPALAVLATTTLTATTALIAVLMIAYAQVREAVRQKEQEAATALARQQEADRERERADALRRQYEELARERAEQLIDAEGGLQILTREHDKAQRSIYALQLSQVAALAERHPARARALLDNRELCPDRLREFTWHYLRRLCDRDEVIYERHTAELTATAAAPDLPLIATADQAGDVRIWDARTGKTWAILVGHTGAVYGVAFAPDSKTVATVGDDGTLRLWELPAGLVALARQTADAVPPPSPPLFAPVRIAPLATVEAHDGAALSVAFRPDGQSIATGGADHVVNVWDIASEPGRAPDHAAVLKGHSGRVLAVAYSPDGQWLATGSADMTVRLWPQTGSPPRRLPPHSAAVTALAFSPDGRTLATADNGDSPAIRLWDVKTLQLQGRLHGHTEAIQAVAFGPDGQLLASGARDRTVRLWATDDGQDRGVLIGHGGDVRSVAFTADRRTVISAAADRTARVWLTRAAGPDSGSVADAQAGTLPITAATVSADGKLIVTGDQTGLTRVWRTDALSANRLLPDGVPTLGRFPLTPFCEPSVLVTGPVAAVAISPDGRYVATAGERGLAILDLAAPAPTQRRNTVRTVLAMSIGFPRFVRDVAFSPDGRLLATAEESGVWVWDVPSGKPVKNEPLLAVEGVRRVAFLSGLGDGAAEPLVAAAVGPTVQILDLTGRSAAVASLRPDAAITALAVDPAGRRLAAGDADGGVSVWEMLANGSVQLGSAIEGHRHIEAVTALAFTRDGRTLVSGSRDRAVVLWDPTTGQERATLTGHTDPLVDVALLPADAGLVTIGRDGSVKRWRADPKTPDRSPAATLATRGRHQPQK
jgi:WD40 repeat protein